jgi:hypothetical protein
MRDFTVGGTELISLARWRLGRGHDIAVFNRGRHPADLLHECHAVYIAHELRRDFGMRPRYTLASGFAQSAAGLHERPIDTTAEDRVLAATAA